MKKPPKKYLRKYITELQYYWGRIEQRSYGTLSLTIWEKFGEHQEYFSNITLKSEGITHTSKLEIGTPVEIWTWNEIIRGKERNRLHIRKANIKKKNNDRI